MSNEFEANASVVTVSGTCPDGINIAIRGSADNLDAYIQALREKGAGAAKPAAQAPAPAQQQQRAGASAAGGDPGWCAEHNSKFYENSKNGKTWFSHKIKDGPGYCNRDKRN